MAVNIPEMLMKLERRLLCLEKRSGVLPSKDDLIHPKAIEQLEVYMSRSLATRLEDLRNRLHAYIYDHYDMLTLLFLVFIWTSNQATPEMRAKVASVFRWVLTVVIYHLRLLDRMQEEGRWIDPNYRQFDDDDPRVSVKQLLYELIS